MADPLQSLTQGLPMLSLIIFMLPAAVVLIWLVPDPRHSRLLALAAVLLDLVVTLITLSRFDSSDPGFQLVEQAEWIPALGVQYLVGVDGISVLFLPLTALLFIGVIISSWTRVRSMVRLYYSLLLILESATLGIFCSLDNILFFLFWELSLLPLYFLISLWGLGPSRRFAAVKYALYMLSSGIPLLIGFLLLALNHAELSDAGVLSFDYRQLLQTESSRSLQITVFLLLLLGFAAKTPLFPLHTWLPKLAMEGPIGIAALMTGIKLGAYGLIRYAVPLAPEAALELDWLLAGLGVAGILYGAVVALAQSNLRGVLAFSSISHVGLVVLGVASFNIQGIQGALFQLLNFTLVAGGIFVLTGFLHHRTGSTDLINLGGIARSMPLLASFFLIFALAGMGMPGTSGFPAEFLILVSALKTHTGAGLAALFAVVIGAGYMLRVYRLGFLGPVRNDMVADAPDLNTRELAPLLLFALLILAVGLHPSTLLDFIYAASDGWLGQVLR